MDFEEGCMRNAVWKSNSGRLLSKRIETGMNALPS